MYAVAVEGPVLRAHKRSRGQSGHGAGLPGESSSSFAVAGSWMTLKKLMGAVLTLAQEPLQDADDEESSWKIATEGLAQRLKENNLELVDVNGKLKVL